MKGVADQVALALANAGLFKEVRTGQERLRRMGQRLVSVQEEERRRLSRQLHDSAGQSLTALQLNLSLVGESLSVHDGDVRQGIDEVLQLAKMAYEEIRAVSQPCAPQLWTRSDLTRRWLASGKPGQGVGLVGMRERFELLGGALQIESQPGKGTRLVGRCPVRLD